MVMLMLLALTLVVVTAWWLSRAMRVGAPAGQVANERADLELLRDRYLAQLSELDAEQADRGVDPAIAQDEELRLSAELANVLKRLEQLTPVQSAGQTPAAAGKPLGRLLTVAIVLLLAVGLYGAINAGNLKGYWLAAEQGGSGAARIPPMVFEMVSRLEKRLAEQPNDAAGWARLGRSYQVMQQPDKAKAAYARAYALAPDNQEVVAEYAWILFNENPGNTSGQVNELYQRLYRLAPNHPDALWFLGFAAYQQGNVKQTLSYWERLLKLLPPEDPGREHLKQAIASAKAKR